jgi:hypothetical protein
MVIPFRIQISFSRFFDSPLSLSRLKIPAQSFPLNLIQSFSFQSTGPSQRVGVLKLDASRSSLLVMFRLNVAYVILDSGQLLLLISLNVGLSSPLTDCEERSG